MGLTADDLFHAALRQYAERKGGDYLAGWYIEIPHQRPPELTCATFFPPDPEADDQYVLGDHDLNGCIPVTDGLTYVGHQALKVNSIARRKMREVFGSEWEASVLCDLYAGQPMSDPDFRRLSGDLLWDCIWPEVDGDMHLTGGIVGDEEGFANVMDEAMMREDVAKKAGLVVEDGYVHAKEVM